LKQTFQDLEIIIINDGSTDNTDEVIGHYLRQPKIKYIKQNNFGQANAKNRGIKNTSGSLIAFLDADDVWEKDKLEKQIPLFDNENVGVVYSRARYIDEVGREIPFKRESRYLKPRSGFVTKFLLLDNFVPFSSSIVRKECIDRAGLFDESIVMGIDWDLWLRISVSYQFDYVNEPLLVYRLGHTGQMSKNVEMRILCADRIMAKFLTSNRSIIDPWFLRRVLNYNYINRGEFYRSSDISLSTRFFLKAIKQWPLSVDSYKGLTKNIITQLIRSVSR